MNRSVRRFLTLAVPAAFLAGSPVASAATCQGAPGASAIQQYCEAIPDAQGAHRGPKTPAAGGESGQQPLPSGTSRELRAAGPDGEAIERLAAGQSVPAKPKSTTPSPGQATPGTSGTSSGSDATTSGTNSVDDDAVDDPSTNVLTAATNAVSNGSTVGSGLAWGVLGMSTIGACAAIVLRRRRDVGDGQ